MTIIMKDKYYDILFLFIIIIFMALYVYFYKFGKNRDIYIDIDATDVDINIDKDIKKFDEKPLIDFSQYESDKYKAKDENLPWDTLDDCPSESMNTTQNLMTSRIRHHFTIY